MKLRSQINLILAIIFLSVSLTACKKDGKEEQKKTQEKQQEKKIKVKEAMLSQQQFDAIEMEIDSLQHRLMSGYVKANGQLEVPPQNEATVTTVIGANISRINVIEGDEVNKGQVLAYISHPDIVEMQTRFLNAANQLNFQEKEYNRQRKLYEAGVGSGESFQKAEAEFENSKGKVNGLRAKLELLHLNPESILNGNIQKQVPLRSPISGAVQMVNVKTGQFVQAQTDLFEIVNTSRVHADLMVFEKDVALVKQGQEVNFTVESLPGVELKAEIISVGKTFEQDPKALHLHAEIIDKPDNLIPGMFVKGKIEVGNSKSIAFPESAIATISGKSFVFKAVKEGSNWSFRPVEVRTGVKDSGWIEVSLLEQPDRSAQFAMNNAYYLTAEMQKGEGGHSH